MIEIIGNFNTARVFATTLEDGAREQIKTVCDTEAFASSKIRIMPDVHAGKGCTIGTTMTITDKVVPGMVGVDIGCGMETVRIAEKEIDFARLDEIVHKYIPCGREVRKEPHKLNSQNDLTALRCSPYLNLSRAQRSIGTLGGGNHFIEVDRGENGDLFIVVHSGSRHIGNEVAKYYQDEGRKAFWGGARHQVDMAVQRLLNECYADAKRTLTTIINPTETMDGAILSGNCVSACDKNTTYHHLNNPVVAELFAQHGKTLNYVCNIITNENVYLADTQRSSDWSAKLCRLLDLDGAIVSQEGFGNPDADLIMNCVKNEKQGIKTVLITDEYAGCDGKSQSLADSDPLADAVVTGGNANMEVVLPPMDKVIGTLDFVDVVAGGHAGSLRPDGSIEAELQIITGATNEMGFNCMSAR